MELHELLCLAAYVSLVAELVFFPVPSEASTYQLFLRQAPRAPEEDRLSRARTRRKRWKLLRYFVPTACGVALFLIPLVLILYRPAYELLLPVRYLETAAVRGWGCALVVVGRVVTFRAALELRRAKGTGGRLAQHGLFRHSRNPGLVGMYLLYAGLALIYPSWILTVGFFPYAFNMHRRVLMEESHLSHSLAGEYAQYSKAVPRYLPLWPLR